MITPKSDQFAVESDQFEDCQILLNGGWIVATYIRSRDKSVFSAISKKLETAHQVEIPDHAGGCMRIQVTDSQLRGMSAALVSIQPGDRVCYSGKIRSLVKVCGSKQLEVVAVNAEAATMNHGQWLVTQTVPLTDLQRV